MALVALLQQRRIGNLTVVSHTVYARYKEWQFFGNRLAEYSKFRCESAKGVHPHLVGSVSSWTFLVKRCTARARSENCRCCLTWWTRSASVLYARGRRDSCVVQPFPSSAFSSNSRSMYGTNSVMKQKTCTFNAVLLQCGIEEWLPDPRYREYYLYILGLFKNFFNISKLHSIKW
jgi:hypothetical protein